MIIYDLHEIIPSEMFNLPHYCGKEYWKWESEITKYLEPKGHTVERWRDGERDSFGPLTRLVTIDKKTYLYG